MLPIECPLRFWIVHIFCCPASLRVGLNEYFCFLATCCCQPSILKNYSFSCQTTSSIMFVACSQLFCSSFMNSSTRGISICTMRSPFHVSSSQMVDLVPLHFIFHFYFHSVLLFYFLFLKQLGLGLISHAVTPVTTWWHSHKIDHETWENLVEDLRTDDIIQYGYHMLALWTTHGCLG